MLSSYPARKAARTWICFGKAKALSPIILPNLIDEDRFRRVSPRATATVRERLCLEATTRLAVITAQLVPRKGILEFVSQLDKPLLSGWRLAIFGEGPLRGQIERLLVARGLAGLVVLAGQVGYDEIPAVHQAADVFVLPSLIDPNPLCVVEALHAGRPLLVSRRLGNLPEALREGVNGWSFEPTDARSIRDAAERAFGCSQETLAGMGAVSSRIGRENWSSGPAVEAFLDTLLIEMSRLTSRKGSGASPRIPT